MGNYSKMPLKEKEILCQNTYTNEILRCADSLQEYERYALVGKWEIPPSCYTNFRDALFHFRKMCNSSEEHEILRQVFAVREHLGRTKTDARITILLMYAKVAEMLLKRDDINGELKIRFRKLLHKMKNVSMINRIQGMMMSDLVINRFSDDEISEIVQEYLDLIQSECLEQFKEIRDELNQKGEKIISI